MKNNYAIAIAGGALLWIATSVVTGRTEAWDSSLYWTVTYPVCIALAAFLGYRDPQRPWRWGLAVMLVQPVVLAITASSFGLMPLGLALFAVLALPPIAAAKLAAHMRNR